MKLLSIAIPSYNSQDYMTHAVESLLPGGDEVEILIVDDGSKDRTAEIADDLEKRYPGIVRAIHQPNGGHGDAVMTGLKNATGLYFKVVDSDDWVDEEAYPKVLATLRAFTESQEGDASHLYARGESVRLGRDRQVPQGPVHPDALGDLPHGPFEGVRPHAAQAHLLCG